MNTKQELTTGDVSRFFSIRDIHAACILPAESFTLLGVRTTFDIYLVTGGWHHHGPHSGVRRDEGMGFGDADAMFVAIFFVPRFRGIKSVGTVLLIRIECTRSLAEILVEMLLN